MLGLLKRKINLGFIVNPFYIYVVAFSLTLLVYLMGWSKIYPDLSSELILFFASTFILFLIAGNLIIKKQPVSIVRESFRSYLSDVIFWLIILSGFVNVFYMGYLPILDRSHNYHEFGMPVIDPLFNTLSIFFAIFFFHNFLKTRNKRPFIYFAIILIIQVLLYRRSTIMWIFTSSSFLYLIYKKKIRLIVLAVGIISIPVLSYCFGLYGNTRSKLTKSFVINDLGASDIFRTRGINYNHYMTYLYVSSPLANLQKTIDKCEEDLNKKNVKEFIFYSIIPESFTSRLERPLHLSPPVCYLISPELIVGTYYLVSFFTMGWFGMIIMFLILFIIICLCLLVIRKWDSFGLETYSLLTSAVALLIFSNFLNRLDVLIMLFIYPILFHFIFNRISILKVKSLPNQPLEP